ncbi:hypothetical protein [Brevundimonas sp. SORGH_AS_0993]|uniref:hypothetical protein n=1 Tax=Brevundimonas sp. SORGH_AS_0993 TaxID=3041794 RepID=UPI0027826B89|nr:hypothetical protein [Brevundimonas sp. SORGH_AS_0993]MDQ1154728.1 hypothetical protein [Brevundimonas sp. SORGH_AS_0993]
MSFNRVILSGLVAAASLTFAQNAAARADPSSDGAYMAALERTGARMTLDMDASHRCFVQLTLLSGTFQTANPDLVKVNRQLFQFAADAMNVRIRDLLAGGQSIPSNWVWVGDTFRAGANATATPQGVAFLRELQADPQAWNASNERCVSAFREAASKDDMTFFQRRAVWRADAQAAAEQR